MSESIEDAQTARETTDLTDDQVDGAQEADGSEQQTKAAEPDTGKPADPAATVLLLGSGELSRELALAFQRL
ncbi:phosphoribosylglycinamide formyltransferase 2, partial [Mycolicibacterium fortuitum]